MSTKTFGLLCTHRDSYNPTNDPLVDKWVQFSLRSLISHLSRTYGSTQFLYWGEGELCDLFEKEFQTVKNAHSDRDMALTIVVDDEAMVYHSDGILVVSNDCDDESDTRINRIRQNQGREIQVCVINPAEESIYTFGNT